MPTDTVKAFVAGMKLRELRAARDRLAAAYDEIEVRAAPAPPREAFGILARGLAALKIGERQVHPEVAGFEVAAEGDPALVRRWVDRLWAELRRGRARADGMPIFGGVLGEWIRPDRTVPEVDPGELRDLLAPWREPSAAGAVGALLGRLDPVELARGRERLVTGSAEVFHGRGGSPRRPSDDLLDPAGRVDAASIPAEIDSSGAVEPFAREWYRAFGLAWDGVVDWDWPAAGAPLVAAWTRNRYRVRPALGWLEATLVEELGDRVADALAEVTGLAHLTRGLRLARLEELNAPPIILENERRLLSQTADVFGWVGRRGLGPPDSLHRQRLGVRSLSADGDYDDDAGSIPRGFAWVQAEVELARVHQRPLLLLHTDLADFYPSVSHHVVRDLLVGLGCDHRLVDLIGRVLSVRLPDGTRTTRGLPLGLSLSRAMGDLLVAAVVGEAVRSADVHVCTLVDDLVVMATSPADLSRAWAAIRAAADDLGLRINEAKTGAVGVGVALPPDVPAAPFRWGLLEHDGERWQVAEEPLQDYAAVTRARIEGHEALLDRVGAWRDQLRWLMAWLAPTADLGPEHAAQVEAAIRRVDPGMAPGLREELGRRFLSGDTATLPEAWLHWPITAGGLGLPWLPAELVPLALDAAARERPLRPGAVEDPQTDEAWNTWYRGRLALLTPRAPTGTPTMDALVERFLERGARMGQAGTELKPYWRWVLHSLGPDVLDAYGTFDFVDTDLVPVHLIRAAGS